MTDLAAESQNLRTIISRLWRNSDIELEPIQGGWIVEVVSTLLRPADMAVNQNRVFEALYNFNSAQPTPDTRIVIHKLFQYEHPDSRYCTGGMLNMRRAQYVNGHHTSYLDAGDAMVWLREWDVELFIFGCNTPRAITLKDGGNAVFRLNAAQTYVQVSFEGEYRAVENVRRRGTSDLWDATVTS